MAERDERGAVRRVAVWALRVAVWLGLVGVAVAFAARVFGWESGPTAYLVAMIPWLVAAAGAALVAALLARWWAEVAVAAALVGLGVAGVAPLFTPAAHDGDVVMTVATVNMRFGEADPQAIVDMVAENGVDVLSVQELTPAAEQALRAAGLEEYLQYSETHAGFAAEGTGLWSRYQPHDAGLVVGLSFNTVRARVSTPAGDVTVFAAHPPPPLPGDQERWSQEIDGLRAAAADVPGAVLIAGDLNSTLDHWPLRALMGDGFVDAADQAGAGFRPTFPQGRWVLSIPLVPIDHVLTRDAAFVASEFATVTIGGADHLAVVVGFALAPGD